MAHHGTIFWSTGKRFLPYIQYLSYQSKRNPNPQVIACLSFGKLRVYSLTLGHTLWHFLPTNQSLWNTVVNSSCCGFWPAALYSSLKKPIRKPSKKARDKNHQNILNKNVPSFHLWSHGAKRRKEPSESSSGDGSATKAPQDEEKCCDKGTQQRSNRTRTEDDLKKRWWWRFVVTVIIGSTWHFRNELS